MSRVIKRTEAPTAAPSSGAASVEGERRGGAHVISGDKYQAKAEAHTIRQRAEDEATGIIEQARAEAARIVEEALQKSAADGYEEGKAKGRAEVQEAVASLVARANQLEAEIVPQLKQLALAIARKILGKELEFHPEAVIDIIRQALSDKARQRREITLRVNPEDLAVVKEHKPELLEVLTRCKEIGLRDDPEVARYGVIIETDAGIIDAQLETQLEVFERILKDAR